MKCPKCKGTWLGVIKTTNLSHDKLRLRICYKCKHVFETKEIIIAPEEQPLQNLFPKKNKPGS